MSDINAARRTAIGMVINGADVSDDLEERLVSLKWSDMEDEEADDLEIILNDRDNVVAGTWLKTELENRANANLNGGSKVSIVPTITQENWYAGDGKDLSLTIGKFIVDEVDLSGGSSGQEVTMKATSLDFSSSARNTVHTRAWENTTLRSIANEICTDAGYSLMYLADVEVNYTRKEQTSETDYNFLQRLCTASGLSAKVTGGAIAIFSQQDYESRSPVRTITQGDKSYQSYSFSASLSDTCYSSCHVSYEDTNTGTTIEYTYTPPGYTYDEDNLLEVSNEKVTTTQEAKELAIARLREANKGKMTASFSMAGDISLVAGLTVALAGFGGFDGDYIIEQGSHQIDRSGGYTTKIDLRQVITEY